MNVVPLTLVDLVLASSAIFLLAALSLMLKLGLTKQILISGLRTAVQLTLVGLILKWLFAQTSWSWIGLICLVMLLVASREVQQRQSRRFAGWWGYGIGASAMLISSFTLTLLALQSIIQPSPWYAPQYSIPLLGMLIGNTMNGVAIGVDRLTQTAFQQHEVIEARLLFGESWSEAIQDIRKDSIKTGLIPILNAMAIAGVVSLPGMMTGQILAGAPPEIAVNYQILMMFLIASGTGFVFVGCRLHWGLEAFMMIVTGCDLIA